MIQNTLFATQNTLTVNQFKMGENQVKCKALHQGELHCIGYLTNVADFVSQEYFCTRFWML